MKNPWLSHRAKAKFLKYAYDKMIRLHHDPHLYYEELLDMFPLSDIDAGIGRDVNLIQGVWVSDPFMVVRLRVDQTKIEWRL